MGRVFRLGQELYFVLWDEISEEAGVARGEVIQYASDQTKVRVKVLDAPQRTVIGRTTWVLPDRLDDDPRTARVNYQRRGREQLREETASVRDEAAAGPRQEAGKVAEATQADWARLCEGWRDVDLLVDTIDFEAGWPEHQVRIAKFAVLSLLRLRPQILALLGSLPAGEPVEAVRTALEGGALGSAAEIAGAQPITILERWDDVPADEQATAADQIAGVRAALDELARVHGLMPALTLRTA